jgi:hypothetical protein
VFSFGFVNARSSMPVRQLPVRQLPVRQLLCLILASRFSFVTCDGRFLPLWRRAAGGGAIGGSEVAGTARSMVATGTIRRHDRHRFTGAPGAADGQQRPACHR